MPASDLDKAFELIEKGNALRKSGNHWGSADSFGQAMVLLQQLAIDASSSKEEDHIKIQQLYQTKSREYRNCARECLILALQFEKDQDDCQSQEQELIAEMISDEEAERRVQIFTSLFSKTAAEEKDASEKTSMLEERLMELNASLPSGFKTSSERLADINRGLGRLGLSIYSHSDERDKVQVELSDDEQVEQIIAQAKDEAMYSKEKHKRNESRDEDSDTSTSDSDGNDSSVDIVDVDSDAEVLKNRKSIRKKVVKAQVKLAELISLLNLKPEDLATGEKDSLDEDSDESQEMAGFDVEHGRNTLITARNYLNKALKEWSDDDS